MTPKLIVGFKTKLAVSEDDLRASMPAFAAPANYKDEAKIDAYVREKQETFVAKAHAMPYLATFDMVVIADPSKRKIGSWSSKDRAPHGKKDAICVAVRRWLLGLYPDAWPDEPCVDAVGETLKAMSRMLITKDDDDAQPLGGYKSRPVFLGFGVRTFLKILGIECSLPGVGKPLPASMWYDAGSRDIEDVVVPRDCEVNWATVLQMRGIEAGTWAGPGNDAEADSRIATELAVQLGFVKG